MQGLLIFPYHSWIKAEKILKYVYLWAISPLHTSKVKTCFWNFFFTLQLFLGHSIIQKNFQNFLALEANGNRAAFLKFNSKKLFFRLLPKPNFVKFPKVALILGSIFILYPKENDQAAFFGWKWCIRLWLGLGSS